MIVPMKEGGPSGGARDGIAIAAYAKNIPIGWRRCGRRNGFFMIEERLA